MEKYQTFLVEAHGRVTPTAPTHIIYVINHASETDRESALAASHEIHHLTHEKAVSYITDQICKRREQVMVELDQLNHNLLKIELLHPAPRELEPLLESQYEELVEGLKMSRGAHEGIINLEWMNVTLGMQGRELVFYITESERCIQSFSAPMIETIKRAVAAAGMTFLADAAGIGSRTYRIGFAWK